MLLVPVNEDTFKSVHFVYYYMASTDLLLPVSELILFLGVALTIGYGLSLILEKLGIPNVLVYIVVGFVIGNLFDRTIFETENYEYWFDFIETIALGLIGFKIGTEIELDLLKDHSKVIVILTLSQVIITFVLVGVAAWLFTGNVLLSLLFGGLATATAPAATIEIIRKYKAKGELTTKTQWVLAFDDIIAVLFVEAVIAYSSIVLLGKSLTIGSYLQSIGQEIGLAILFGIVVGFILDLIIEEIHLDNKLEMMEISLGFLILIMGVSLYVHTSVILSTMTVGAITVNRAGNNYKDAGELLEIIMSPVLIVFFVLIGAEVTLDAFSPIPWFAGVYFIFRAIGKIYGTNWGAKISEASPVIRQNLGLCMLPQGGVALGLMAVAADLFQRAGDFVSAELLISTIVISTVFSEGIGSFASLYGLGRAGELATNKIRDNPLAQKAMENSNFTDM